MRTRTIERVLLAAGLTLLTMWIGARLHRTIGSSEAIAEFEAQGTSASSNRGPGLPDSVLGVPVDLRLWSAKRISAYEDSVVRKTDAPLGILRIPKINLEVPVFNDTDDLTLNRGVGRILGTAQIGQIGNLGIAGHRDGFFRGLKDMGLDDIVELIRPGGTDHYVITQVQTVNPEDVSVLAPTPTPTLTLVTCFPFYYVGNAPQRYVVTASYQTSNRSDERVNKNSISTGKKTNKKEKQDEVN